jgi:hypothetical protein
MQNIFCKKILEHIILKRKRAMSANKTLEQKKGVRRS